MKWIGVAILTIIGVLAAIVAVIYLSVPIHSLPSFVPGKHAGGGTYHKRGALAAVIALVAFAAAGGLGMYFRRLMPGSYPSRSRAGTAAPAGRGE